MHRIALVLTLALAFVPVVALAVELPGEVVDTPVTAPIQVQQDHRAAWEAHLRQERAQRIADLRAYANAGVFPVKPEQQGWHHQFLDGSGTPCAVASLIATDGHWDLVRQTAATDNDVVLSELEGGPLIDWVATSGLTIEEIAVIQVPGFTESIRPIEAPEPSPRIADGARGSRRRAYQAEQARIRAHLSAVLTLIEVDTEASIAKAMDRLGDRVNLASPATLISMQVIR